MIQKRRTWGPRWGGGNGRRAADRGPPAGGNAEEPLPLTADPPRAPETWFLVPFFYSLQWTLWDT